MNHEHLKFVFGEYGRYHGTNFALKKLKPAMYKELIGNLVDMIDLFNQTDGFSHLVRKMSAKVTHCLDPVKEKKYYDVISAFNNISVDHMKTTSEKDEYSIILHGDCWCNNMMFKYKDENDNSEPDSMQLIDFQLCKEGSPVLDLAYFFYVCSDKPSFQKLDEYLQFYHEKLTKHLAEFGLDSHDIYPFKKLKEHWTKYSKFGYIMAVFLIRIMLSDADEVPDLADVADSNANNENSVLDSFNFESRSEDVYRQRMRDLVIHMIDHGFIN